MKLYQKKLRGKKTIRDGEPFCLFSLHSPFLYFSCWMDWNFCCQKVMWNGTQECGLVVNKVVENHGVSYSTSSKVQLLTETKNTSFLTPPPPPKKNKTSWFLLISPQAGPDTSAIKNKRMKSCTKWMRERRKTERLGGTCMCLDSHIFCVLRMEILSWFVPLTSDHDNYLEPK